MIIDDLVRGSIDMHCHHAPDALIEGRMDALETVKLARQMGMRAVVLKSTYFPTAPMADIIGKLIPEVKVFGGVCLDYERSRTLTHSKGSSKGSMFFSAPPWS